MQRQLVQWVGRRCCAAGYDGRAAARLHRLGNLLCFQAILSVMKKIRCRWLFCRRRFRPARADFRLRFYQQHERRARDEQDAGGDEGGLVSAFAQRILARLKEHLRQAAQGKPAHAPRGEEDAVVHAEADVGLMGFTYCKSVGRMRRSNRFRPAFPFVVQQ
jgi:hypothetical protein